jgi:hypothetical protein
MEERPVCFLINHSYGACLLSGGQGVIPFLKDLSGQSFSSILKFNGIYPRSIPLLAGQGC